MAGMRWPIIAGSLVIASLLSTTTGAQDHDLAAGKLLYREQCSTCHGMLESEARQRTPAPPPWQHASLPTVAPWLAMTSGNHRTQRQQVASLLAANGTPLAVAPPYGPPLRGIVGRRAGSVPGFTYSRAFQTVLQGVVWDRGTLNVWMFDSQAWVPGSVMFYKQPDATVRHKIITYLEAHR
jgi:cytochrome c2